MSQPIFDSLSHPTLSADWMGKGMDAGFESLVSQLKANNYCNALAVGLYGFENYSHTDFIAKCNLYPELIPIAGMDVHIADYKAEIDNIHSLGFKGIKIHPRISELDYKNNNIANIIEYCGTKNLVVLYCTYAHCKADHYPSSDPFYDLVNFIRDCNHTKIILMHGGDVELMKYAELVRFNANLILDLSLTIMKYEGSSLDADLRFLFEKFDQRICIGTDHPEYSHLQLRHRFESICTSLNLNEEKQENVAWKNLSNVFK